MNEIPTKEVLRRALIGSDHIFQQLKNIDEHTGYPPLNIIGRGKDRYEIQLAVAGFKEDNLEIQFESGSLVISAKKTADDDIQYYHKGISNRSFKKRFTLADYVVVKGANLNDGILTVNLERELPDEMKPKIIKINRQDE